MSEVAPGAVESLPLSDEVAAELNRRFDSAPPTEILQWIVDTFPKGKVALSSTFGVGGMVRIHLMAVEGRHRPGRVGDTLGDFRG
jgi:hypothetical protein